MQERYYFCAIVHLPPTYPGTNLSFLTFEKQIEGKLLFCDVFDFQRNVSKLFIINGMRSLGCDLCCHNFLSPKYLVLTIALQVKRSWVAIMIWLRVPAHGFLCVLLEKNWHYHLFVLPDTWRPWAMGLPKRDVSNVLSLCLLSLR